MSAIVAKGIRVHNLKNIDITIPHRRMTVVTGVSGSGKSSLAFDTLYAEGQRRYIESMSSYTRQFLERMEKPDVDQITGMLPAIAIESKNVVTSARSTVGTQTEINDFLRLLFARIGHTFCRNCGQRVKKESAGEVAADVLTRFLNQTVSIIFEIPLDPKAKKYLSEARAELFKQGFTRIFLYGKIQPIETVSLKKLKDLDRIAVVVDRIEIKPEGKSRLVDSLESAYRHGRGQVTILTDSAEKRYSEHFHCSNCDIAYREPHPNIFSFNSPLGACPECQGFGRVITIDLDLVIPNKNKSIAEGAIEPWTKPSAHWQFYQLKKFCQKKRISLTRPWKDLPERQRKLIIEGSEGYFSVRDFFDFLEKKTYKMHVRVFLAKYRTYVTCKICQGLRLKQEALLVKIQGRHMAEISAMTIHACRAFFDTLSLSSHDKEASAAILSEIRNRLRFLDEVGLGYLTLDRASRTLSGGEAQRIHLATSLGSALVDTLYVLDEPSIGLHERDNNLLLRLLKQLCDLGNTVLVVEHDQAMIKAGDEVLDLGPSAGKAGGEIIYHGSLDGLLADRKSRTAAYLSGRETIAFRKNGRSQNASTFLSIEGASEHNLNNINAKIPLGSFCVITGVSGSGKSTLLYDIVYKNYLRYAGQPVKDIGSVKKISGFQNIQNVILIDQSPIGRTPRSNPATYVGIFSEIRKVFSRTREARQRRLEPGAFSFNVDGGRCPKCKGDGKIKVEMHFLADIFIDCDQCNRTRYQDHILSIHYRGKNIHQVLELTIDEAVELFADHEIIKSKLAVLASVGLGYLRLGQSAHTLSAGEAQRLKLAYQLLERSDQKILYLFDEPTTGLHYDDIQYLMSAFERLLAAGHSILLIEHNMEVIKCADWIVDLGPEGGDEGGRVVACGTPEAIALTKGSHTGRFLKTYISK